MDCAAHKKSLPGEAGFSGVPVQLHRPVRMLPQYFDWHDLKCALMRCIQAYLWGTAVVMGL